MQASQQVNPQAIQQAPAVAYVAGIGMLTPVGVNTDMTLASVQAGISQYSVTEYLTHDEKPITMACVPEEFFTSMDIEIDEGRRYGEQYDHIIKMAVVALREAVSRQDISEPIPLLLAMPEPDEDADHIPMELLTTNLLKQDDLPLSADQIRSIHTGRASGLQALELAFRYLYEAGHDFVLIGGSDSYLSYPRLDTINEERLKTPGSMDSFAPGEGAGFLLLSKDPQTAIVENDYVIALYPPGIAEEAGHLLSEENYLGDGLDQAFKQALNGHEGQIIQTIYSSMNGERYWSKEYGVALIRNRDCFTEEYEIEHPAEYFGDLGAATGSVLMGLAAKSLLRQEESNTNLVYSSSDSAWRAAVKLERRSLSADMEAK